MDKNFEEYIYKFSPTASEDPTTSRAFGLIKKLVDGGKLSVGMEDGFDGWKHKDEKGNYITSPDYVRADNDYALFTEIGHWEAYKKGIIKQAGWIFDFRPFFRKFLVKTKYSGWQEHYAPNKTFIRKCAATPSHVLRIIEIED